MFESVALVGSVVAYVAAAYLLYRACLGLLRVRWARHAYPQTDAPACSKPWQDRCRGALLGVAIGDAVNLPAESLPRWVVRLRYRAGPQMRHGVVRFARRAGDVSDDTQLTIAAARSISPEGVYSHRRFVNELRCWSYFRLGAGRASSKAAVRARRKDALGEVSEGNGVAVRVAPFAIACVQRSDKELLEMVTVNGRATHDSAAAISAAVFMAVLVREALRHWPRAFDDVRQLRMAVARAQAVSKFELGLALDEAVPDDETLAARLREMGTGGHVYQCVPAVVLVLLRHRLDFRGAMHAVFAGGGDTDSIGSMVGAVIGAQVGAGALPDEWLRTVQHRDYLCWLGDRLSVRLQPAVVAAQVVHVVGDVATRPVDVVVNAWNRNVIPPWLLLPQGVSKAIRRAGGRDTIGDIGRRAPLPLGSATESHARSMSCDWVVHVAGIDLLWRASEASVRDAIVNALALCQWLGARTVAIPLVGAGSGGMGTDLVRLIAINELRRHADQFDRLELVSVS